MPKLLQNKGDGITMMGTLHAKEDNSQYPIMDTPNGNRNNANSNGEGLWGVNTQGEYTNPAQPEERSDASGEVSQRVHAIISGENMTCVHALADDSTWQDATHKTARRGESNDGGGNAGTLPPSFNNSAHTSHTPHNTLPHNIDLKNSMLGATINNEFCYGSSSIIGATIDGARATGTRATQQHPEQHAEQPYLRGCTDALINNEFCYGDSSIIGARIGGATIDGARATGTRATQQHPEQHAGQPYLRGCTDALINNEFCYGDSSIIGARIGGATIDGATIDGATTNANTPHQLPNVDLGSTESIASAYASVSSASLHSTLSKVLSSYMASTDAHGSIASSQQARTLVRDIANSFKGQTFAINA